MAMKMHQVHVNVNGSTVQTVVEVKGRTGHSGFGGGSHKEVPSMQLKLADTQKETGSSREGLPPPSLPRYIVSTLSTSSWFLLFSLATM